MGKRFIWCFLLVVVLAVASGWFMLFPAMAAAPPGPVQIELTFPAGASPKVFTTGWVFGARCILNPGTPQQKDISDQVRWSGSGTFSPEIGAISHPSFAKAGGNTIVLSVKVGSKTYHRSFRVSAVNPAKYASVGTYAGCLADAHGCPACPHPVSGPILTGSPDVTVRGKPAARVGDTGKNLSPHVCCGPNTFTITSGDPQVLIDGKPAAKIGSTTQHCGGTGKVGLKIVAIFTMVGRFSGQAQGQATFNIGTGTVTGEFKGDHGLEGGGVVDVQLKGTYDSVNERIHGTMRGTSTYLGYENQVRKATVTGTFQGTLSSEGLRGTWHATAKGGGETRKANGTFTASRK